MRSQACRYIFLFLILSLFVSPILAQSKAKPAAQLFIRYEGGASGNRLVEDVLTLSIENKDKATVAIRVCSKEPMPFALATSEADPFRISELLREGYAYPSERVLFLRSE